MKKSFAAQIPASVLAILSLLGFATGWIVTRFQAAMEDFHIDMEVYEPFWITPPCTTTGFKPETFSCPSPTHRLVH